MYQPFYEFTDLALYYMKEEFDSDSVPDSVPISFHSQPERQDVSLSSSGSDRGPVEIRKEFPETWLFESFNFDEK